MVRHYLCPRATTAPTINGRLTDPAWQDAPWTDDFDDIEGDLRPKPTYRTRAKMLWDDQYLYIGAELEDPHVWGTLTQHDSVIFQDNDFEVFIDPDDDNQLYGEFEINALNTTWDLLLVRPYRAGGPAINGWEIHGLRSAVHVNGTLNNPHDTDHGWTVEIAIPWASLAEISTCPVPPTAHDRWRINFSRVQWKHEVIDGKYHKVPNLPEHNWVWSPIGIVDMHCPHRWGILEFVSSPHDPSKPNPEHDTRMAARARLHLAWDAQARFRGQHGHWARTVEDLGVEGVLLIPTAAGFELRHGEYVLNQDQRFGHVPNPPA